MQCVNFLAPKHAAVVRDHEARIIYFLIQAHLSSEKLLRWAQDCTARHRSTQAAPNICERGIAQANLINGSRFMDTKMIRGGMAGQQLAANPGF